MFSPQIRRKLWAAFALGLVAALVLDAFWRFSGSPRTAVLLPSNAPFPTGSVISLRWIPRWDWLRHLRWSLFGQPKTIQINAVYFQAVETLTSFAKENNLGDPLAQSDSMALWIKPRSAGIQHLGTAAVIRLAAPWVTIPEGHSGAANTGFFFGRRPMAQFTPYLRPDGVDLWARLSKDPVNPTNLPIVARVLLPYDSSLVLVETKNADEEAKRIEIVITADVFDARGRRVPPEATPVLEGSGAR